MLAYTFASKCLHMIANRRDVFHAIADPTRREIIQLVAHKPLNINEIAQQFDVTRQAVSLHVKILSECGLVLIKQHGRERYCEAKLDKLEEISTWLHQYKQFWEQKFDALDAYLEKIQEHKKHHHGRKK